MLLSQVELKIDGVLLQSDLPKETLQELGECIRDVRLPGGASYISATLVITAHFDEMPSDEIPALVGIAA